MSDSRTDTARANDDRALIEGQEDDPDAVAGATGGTLARDVGSRDDAGEIDDPDGTIRATKQADIDAGVTEPSNRVSSGDAAGSSDG